MIEESENRKALVVVAHCDDAVLWMGGVIHRLRNWDWHIFSLCDGSGQRDRSFYRSCSMLCAKESHAFHFEDYSVGRVFSRNNKEEMKTKLIEHIDKAYDYVFSHGLMEWNEYNHHANHEEAGIVASEIAKEKSWPLIQFCYRPIYPGGIATVADDKRADYYFQLNYKELRFKLDLIEECFQKEIEYNLRNLSYPCPNPEAFEGCGLPEPFTKSGFVCKPAKMKFSP